MPKRQSTCLTRLWASGDGGGLVEFALLAPILSVLFVGMTDVSLGIWTQMQVGAAARAGAAQAVATGFDSTKISNAVTSAVSLASVTADPAPSLSCGCPDAASGIVAATCGAACPSGGTAGQYVTVSARANYSTLFNWPGLSNSGPLTATAKVRIN